MPVLLAKEGPASGEVLQLAGARFAIGRDPDNDLRLDERTVSRRHALLTLRPDGWYLTDLGSHNGTVVNGAAVGEVRLSHGDEIRVGTAVLAFMEHEPAPPVAPAPQPSGGAGEVTQTIFLDEFGRPGPGASAVAEGAGGRDHRLGQLLALAELAVSVRGLPALFDGVVRVLQATLTVDRAVPIVEEDGRPPRAYCADTHGFVEGIGALEINGELLDRCGRDGSAVCWHGAGGGPNVACAPVRVGDTNHGFLYCDRADPTAEFSNQDLTYLLAVAMQTGLAIENIACYERMTSRARNLSRQLSGQCQMVGDSRAMQAVYDFIRKVAPTDAGVLICGESGTGKEMVARAIHHRSRRSDGPLEVLNCAAVQPTLLESELFGHMQGAFTGAVSDKAGRFELADGGTLFLDEVVELPVECQSKLLRVLEEGRIRRVGDTRERAVDVRLIAATNRDVARAVADGSLRADLFYRLDRLRVELPPLRGREGDVSLLAGYFLEQFRSSSKRGVAGFEPEVLEVFGRYRWPGNVRELRNVVERMLLLGEGKTVRLSEAPADLRTAAERGGSGGFEPLEEVERRHVLRALEEAGGNKKRAAEMLGIDRSTLYARLRRYARQTGGASPS